MCMHVYSLLDFLKVESHIIGSKFEIFKVNTIIFTLTVIKYNASCKKKKMNVRDSWKNFACLHDFVLVSHKLKRGASCQHARRLSPQMWTNFAPLPPSCIDSRRTLAVRAARGRGWHYILISPHFTHECALYSLHHNSVPRQGRCKIITSIISCKLIDILHSNLHTRANKISTFIAALKITFPLTFLLFKLVGNGHNYYYHF